MTVQPSVKLDRAALKGSLALLAMVLGLVGLSGCGSSTRFAPKGIVFASERDDHPSRTQIYTVAADGQGLKRLTRGREQDLSPAWSADGNRIAFVRESGAHHSVFVVRSDGSHLALLVRDASAPAWSPDGRRLAFVRNHGLWVIGADGGGERRIASDAEGGTWSPDGRRIAFSSAGLGHAKGIWIAQVDGGGESKLTGADDGGFPAWSPDGSAIAFVRGADDRTNGELWLVTSNNSGHAKPLVKGGGSYSVLSPSWSPDGLNIAFDRLEGDEEFGPDQIWTVAIADGSLRRVTDGPVDLFPSWRG